MEADRQRAQALDHVEECVALVVADGVAENTTELADVLAQRLVDVRASSRYSISLAFGHGDRTVLGWASAQNEQQRGEQHDDGPERNRGRGRPRSRERAQARRA